MNPNPMEFRSGVISPVECLKEGWATIKDQYWLFFGITFVGMLVGGAVPIVLIGPMMCGLFLCLLAQMRNEPVEFGMLFKGFDYFMQGLVVAAIQHAPAVVIGFIVGMFSAFVSIALSGPRNSGPPVVLVIILIVLVIITVVINILFQMLFIFAYPLIVERNLSGLDAVSTSFRAVRKNFGGVLGLTLLNAGLTIVGFFCCIIGVYFVLPVTFAAQAAAYRRVFPDAGRIDLSAPPPPLGSWAA